MKKLILPVLIIGMIVNSCKKGDNPGDGCPIDNSIANNYLNDAQEIVYKRILNGDAVIDGNQPEFNQTELNKVLSGIESVYILHTPQTDSIFNFYNIHSFKTYLLNSIELKVDRNSPEIQNLISLKPTGNVAFDALLAKYNFTWNNLALYPSSPFINIKSTNWYNMQALLPFFNSYPFILSEQVDGTVGGGSDITYRVNGNDRIIDFSFGYGDCPAGCIGHKTWEFAVNANCTARFVKFTDGR